jgi:uncharacterized protein
MLESRLRWVVLLLFAVAVSFAEDLSKFPKPTGYVSDLANVISASDKEDLESFCKKVETQLGAQFAIVTIKTLDGQPIEGFSNDLFRKLGVGPKASNQGLLILLAIQDHKQRIEVGRGLEPYITDAFAGETERDMRPLERANDFGGALKQSTLALATHLAEGKNIPFSDTLAVPVPVQLPPQQSSHDDNSGSVPITLIIFFVVFLLLIFLNRRGGGGRGTGSGFWTGFILSSLLNSGGRGGGGGSWGGGGGFGGGDSGGGGFGGFGGGDSGGGGASSDW